MAYLAVDEDGTEIIFRDKPLKYNKLPGIWHPLEAKWFPQNPNHEFYVVLPKGTIEKLIGKTLTFEDGTVELK